MICCDSFASHYNSEIELKMFGKIIFLALATSCFGVTFWKDCGNFMSMEMGSCITEITFF